MEGTALILNLLIAYGAFQAFLISAVLLRSGNKSLFNRLFAFLLIIEGITLFERLLVETELINSLPHFLGISYPISFLKPTLMLLMAHAITDSQFKLKRKMLWHLIPFGLMLLMNLPMYFTNGTEKLAWAKAFMEKIPSYQSFEFYFSLSFFLYIGVYIFLAVKRLNAFRQQIVNNKLVNWYRIILIIYSAFLFFHLVYYLIQPLGKLNFAIANQLSMLAMTFIIQSIAFKLIDKSPLLQTKTPDLSDLQKRKEIEELILRQFEEHQVHLNDELNLQKFSDAISLPATEVSKIINQKFNCTFKKLLSQYRVEEAKNKMKVAGDSKIKLIDIAHQVGFNNKVSFYRAFKEFENISPSDYLEKVKKGEI
ncbi:MAG: helix-turn-helix domain-containing protein [Flavobacteriales bacterium]|nr:helix-turn-helix domain-containing protein [Flavobacteriales bacterium]